MRAIEPPVVRVLEVPTDFSAYELHLALQVALGYNDYEPFEFVRPGLTVGVEPAYAGTGLTHQGHRYRHADEVEAGHLWRAVGQALDYTYDFARLWGYTITLLSRRESDAELPRCLESAGAAPPEDVDSLEAYYGLLVAFADPALELHGLAVEILGADFDPRGPSAGEVTDELAGLFAAEVEPHGTEVDDDYDWWDPSKYDEAMRIRVKREEIDRALPASLDGLAAAEKQSALLRALRS